VDKKFGQTVKQVVENCLCLLSRRLLDKPVSVIHVM